MEQKDYEEKWAACLSMIREKYGEKYHHWFDVWFADVRFEHYDPDAHTLLLQVPSKYVYEYLEMHGVKTIRETAREVFGTDITLQYRILKEPQFADVAAYLAQHSAYDTRRDPYNIHVADAEKRLRDGLRYFLKGSEQWLPAYGQIAAWLQDNKGRGLLCVGHPGLGKTLICEKILPVILGNGGRPIASVKASSLHDRLPELMKERIVIIDDLGKEPAKHYGNIDRSFFELCNNAERTGQLLIITTNLATARPASWPADRPWPWPDSIEHRYGQEVLDRLKVITSVVRIEGKSMRS
jgi:DNA replication protein DnaC